jgi:hypothetical protein
MGMETGMHIVESHAVSPIIGCRSGILSMRISPAPTTLIVHELHGAIVSPSGLILPLIFIPRGSHGIGFLGE